MTGVLIFNIINYGMTCIGINPYWQFIIKRGIIIFAVALDSMKYVDKSSFQQGRVPSALPHGWHLCHCLPGAGR